MLNIEHLRKVKRNKDRRLSRRRCASRRKKTIRNRGNLHIPKKIRKKRNAFKRAFKGYKRIPAPANFSLINNPGKVLEFIDIIHSAFLQRRKIFVELENVQEITMDALVLLLSHMTRFKENHIKFNGSRPRKADIAKIIEASQFYDLAARDRIPKQFVGDSEYTFNLPSFYTHAKKNVDSKLTADIIADFAKEIWGEKRRCTGVQRIFIELMQNTNNHANELLGEEYWWLSAVHKKDTNTVCLSFIDYGMGIFESLKAKKPGEKFFGWIEAMIKANCNPNNHFAVLEQMLLGNFHRTITKKYFRGKGIPGIHEQLEKGSISKLVIISNDAYADASEKMYYSLEYPLRGTFVYFEVNETCKNLPYNE